MWCGKPLKLSRPWFLSSLYQYGGKWSSVSLCLPWAIWIEGGKSLPGILWRSHETMKVSGEVHGQMRQLQGQAHCQTSTFYTKQELYLLTVSPKEKTGRACVSSTLLPCPDPGNIWIFPVVWAFGHLFSKGCGLDRDRKCSLQTISHTDLFAKIGPMCPQTSSVDRWLFKSKVVVFLHQTKAHMSCPT